MTTETYLVSSELRNRFSKPMEDEDKTSMEEVLIDKLDKFLSSVESHLDSFEQYFQYYTTSEEEDATRISMDASERGNNTRRSSSASMSSMVSLKLASVNNLKATCHRLRIMKDSVLKFSYSNLDKLCAVLDLHYGHLVKIRYEEDKSFDLQSQEGLAERIITTIQYLDETLSQIDSAIYAKAPRAKDDYESPAFKHLRFYNFNRALRKAKEGYLHYYDLPLSWRENRYIIFGYRFSLSHKNMLGSVLKFNHNESMNIWSHLLGTFIVAWISFVSYPSTDVFARGSFYDRASVYLFLSASAICLISSSTWHTYSCFAAYRIRSNCACVDYTGITVLITASVISAEYCALYEYPTVMKIFIGFSIFCGSLGCTFNWSPHFDKPECRGLRIGFFMSLAFLGFSTAICKFFFEGISSVITFFFPMVYKSFLWYWIGVVFYGCLFPERWRYDVIINEEDSCSHDYQATDILHSNIEHSGEEEVKEIQIDLKENGESLEEALDDDEDGEDGKDIHNSIIEKHFPKNPLRTVYNKDFFSLWWVDYCFSSHNLWHICVLFGIIGHYYSLIEMFEKVL